MRYLEWTYVSADQKQTIIKEFAYLLKDESGNVKVEYDRHILGLFSSKTMDGSLFDSAPTLE